VLGKPDRHHPRQLVDPALRHRIGDLVRNGEDGVHGRHVDDGPAAPLPHHGPCRRLAAEKGGLEVRAQHAVEILLGHVEEIGVVRDPGVVHEDVDAPEGLFRARDERLRMFAIAHVPLSEDRPGALRREPLRGGLDLLGLDVAKDHLRALPGEALGDRKADALRGPGHHRYPVLQAHATLLTKSTLLWPRRRGRASGADRRSHSR
jgi:hypothetical protein